ncbi:MAG: efflux RND transporter periplasmic adaptor subunit [Spirochaetota bacterium]
MKIGKKLKVIIVLTVLIIAVLFYILYPGKEKKAVSELAEINPHYGTVTRYVATTGTVQPRNRLEVMPPINGRVESVLVNEGDRVNKGQILVWMSSADRAALIDAARIQGREQVKYWEEAYKPIPITAPISGTVIVRGFEPGQNVSTSDAILVISDILLMKGNVDETDVGRIKEGQNADITLDAYPDISVKGKVMHINYESTTVNNVTTYEVRIVPDTVPSIFKSGMNANIKIYDIIKENILLIPVEAVQYEKGIPFVAIKKNKGEPEKRFIETGISDEVYIEVISGIEENEIILSESGGFLQKNNSGKQTGTNPFMPSPGRGRGR